MKPAATLAERPSAAWNPEKISIYSIASLPELSVHKDDDGTLPKKNNRRGVASLLCMGLLFVVFTAVVIITPTIPGGLALMLDVLGFASSIAAIILGKRGLKYDRNKGYAMAGLGLGYAVLGILIFMHLLLLLIMGSYSGFLY